MSAYCTANADVRYTLDNFLEMRRNYAAYSVFYSTFLPAIVGRVLMKRLVADAHTFADVATPSDEALALLALENGVDRWDDIFTRCDGDVRPYAKGQEMPEAHKSTVPTKYTVSSNPHPTTEKEGSDKRWSKDGIIRFNQLRQMIIQDRIDHPEFAPKWLAEERESVVVNPTTSTTKEDNLVDADDDFSEPALQSSTGVLKPASQTANVLDDSDESEHEDTLEGNDEDDDDFGNGPTTTV
jgi:hypothetical protein